MTDKTYLCLQASRPSGEPAAEMSPSDMEEKFKAFNAWREKYAGNIVDMGGRLVGDAVNVNIEGHVDGPLAEVKELVGGYMIISAADMDEAIRIAGESPAGMGNSTVMVREIVTS